MYKYDGIQMSGQSDRTEEMHDYTRKNLIALLGDKEIAKLSLADARRWFTELYKTRQTNTVRGYILKLRRVLEYCEARKVPALSPKLIPVLKREEKKVNYVTPEEVAAMIDNAYNIRAKFVISLLYSSGIRLNEFINLNRGDIYQKKFTVIGKGGKVRLCFIDERTEDLMNEYLVTRDDKCNALVVSLQNKERMTRTNVELLVKNAARRAGIKKRVTPHTLRHGYATDFLRNNGNVVHLSKMLGHKNIEPTMMYLHLVDNDLEEQYRKYHSI